MGEARELRAGLELAQAAGKEAEGRCEELVRDKALCAKDWEHQVFVCVCVCVCVCAPYGVGGKGRTKRVGVCVFERERDTAMERAHAQERQT